MSELDGKGFDAWRTREPDLPSTHQQLRRVKCYVCDTCGPIACGIMPKPLALAHQKATGHTVRFVAEIER